MQAEAILAIAGHRADAAEVFVTETDRTVVEFRGGRFQAQETRLARGCGLRVIKDGRLGFSTSTNDDRYDGLIDAALETAALGRPATFEFARPDEYPAVIACNSRVMLQSAGRMVEWGRDLCAAMRSRVPELRLDLTFYRTWHETRIMTTAGLDAGFERATFELRVNGVLAGDGITMLPEYQNLSDGRLFDPGPLCDRLETTALNLRRRARIASGVWPVIFMPLALPDLLAPLAYGVNGLQLERNTSPLIGREGEPVIADCLTVSDDPLRSYGLETTPFDAEGLPARRNPLFDRGRFGGFIHDLRTAAACGAQSTGSARRDYDRPPVPWPASLVIEPGTAALADTIRDTREGLLVFQCVGGGQSNMLAGEIALNLTPALKVEQGELVGRVKNLMLAGNIYELLGTVDRVGAEPHDLGGSLLPWLRFPGLRLAAGD